MGMRSCAGNYELLICGALLAWPRLSQATLLLWTFCTAFLRSTPSRRQELLEPLIDDGVALARGPLEAGTVENLNFPSAIIDEAPSLQRLRSKRHRLAISA